MRYLYAAAFLGVGLFVAFSLWAGWGEVAGAVERLGWGVALIVGARAISIAAVGMAWHPLVAIFAPVSRARCMALRWVRDAVNNLLPVAQIGGEIIGARLLALGGVPLGPAGSSVLVDFSMQVATQIVFAFCGLGLLVALGVGGAVVHYALSGLLIFTLAVGGFLLAQRRGGVHFVEGLLKGLAQRFSWGPTGDLSNVGDSAEIIYRHRGAVAQAFLVHLGVWFFGAVEIYIGLRFLGAEPHFSTAVVIESLGQAVKGAAFSVPGAVGVQEGGYIALCAIFGIAPPVAIALSLAKRAPDVIMGVPGLIYWRLLERRGRDAAGGLPLAT